MSLTLALTVGYIMAFQACAVPAIARMVRMKSSKTCSIWREVLILTGVTLQGVVMVRTEASWFVLASPIASSVSIFTLLLVVLYFRRREAPG